MKPIIETPSSSFMRLRELLQKLPLVKQGKGSTVAAHRRSDGARVLFARRERGAISLPAVRLCLPEEDMQLTEKGEIVVDR